MKCTIRGKMRFLCSIGKDEVECDLTVEYKPHDGYLELMSFTKWIQGTVFQGTQESTTQLIYDKLAKHLKGVRVTTLSKNPKTHFPMEVTIPC